jgi:hypothetical protein
MATAGVRLRYSGSWRAVVLLACGISLPAAAGPGVWTSSGPEGGAFVGAMALDAGSPATIYAATILGGVFKSTDAGGHWFPANAGLTNFSINALAADPSNPGVVYAGTGKGVFKTTDGATTWTLSNTGLGYNLARTFAIDSVTPTKVYSGTSNGVFRSTDGGATWAASGLVGLTVFRLVLDPVSSSTLYAGTLGGGVYKSSDGGTSWTAVNSGITDLNIYGLAVDPVNLGVLYAGGYGRRCQLDDDGLGTHRLRRLHFRRRPRIALDGLRRCGKQWRLQDDRRRGKLDGRKIRSTVVPAGQRDPSPAVGSRDALHRN